MQPISKQAVINTIDKWVKDMDILTALPASKVTPLFDNIHNLQPINLQDILQDTQKEIELREKTLTDKYGQIKYGVWTDDVCNVFDKYIEKYSNT